MNKYQEARNNLQKRFKTLDGNRDWGTILELVDKETPMKPVLIFGTECCAKCKQCLEVNHVPFTRCNNVDCGQVVDWTDESE